MSLLDPVTLAVIQSGLQQVCNEMDLAFVRSAFSPVISEALDRSDGIYHPEKDRRYMVRRRDGGVPLRRADPDPRSLQLSRRPSYRTCRI